MSAIVITDATPTPQLPPDKCGRCGGRDFEQASGFGRTYRLVCRGCAADLGEFTR